MVSKCTSKKSCATTVEEEGYPCNGGAAFTATVKREVDRRVVRRYGVRKCEYPGCHIRRGLSYHHKRPQWAGGDRRADNACLLCRNHHEDADEAIILPEEMQESRGDQTPAIPLKEQDSIRRLVEEIPSRTPSPGRGHWEVFADFKSRLAQLRCCVPDSESLRVEVQRHIASTQLALAGLLTSGLPANLVPWDQSDRFQIDMLAKSAHTLANDASVNDHGICIRAKHSRATKANAWVVFDDGGQHVAVRYVEEAIRRARSSSVLDDSYMAYLLRNAAVMHGKAGNADRGTTLMNESVRICEHEPEGYVRYAEVLMLQGDLQGAERWTAKFLDATHGLARNITDIQRVIALRMRAIHYALTADRARALGLLNEARVIASENDLGHQGAKIDDGATYFKSSDLQDFIRLHSIGLAPWDNLPITLRRVI